MAEKRFRYYETSEDTQIWDSQRNAFYDDFDLDKIAECLNNLHEENEHLRAEVYILQDDILNKRVRNLIEENEQLKQFISKIDFAIIRKYDNSLENLLDEVYDGEYENWIKKQVSRAKKLDGDV